ncbi:MAG: DUF1700 domain-containing protein [Ruminococcus sp.]|nr:DUF1700 domain-containing protein [Ruminococcus sp.]
MNRERFISELREALRGLSQSDIDERVEFYSEMINDRMEDGLTEEEAMAEIGSVESVVEQIMGEIPITALVKEKVRPKRKLKAWEIVLLVLGSPVWLPLLIAALAVLLSLYIVVWSVVICFYAAAVSLAAGVIAALVGAFGYLRLGKPAAALFAAGAAIACAGLSILMSVFCVWLTKAIVKGTGKVLLKIKRSFVGKGE